MPTKERRITQYHKNKTLANSKLLKQEQYRDWRIVLIYYSALHYIDSTYANVNFHPHTHNERKEGFSRFKGYDDIIDDYDNLEMLSRKSRYNCVTLSNQEVEDAIENLHIIEEFIKNKNDEK